MTPDGIVSLLSTRHLCTAILCITEYSTLSTPDKISISDQSFDFITVFHLLYNHCNSSMSGPRTKRQFAGAASDPAQRQITSFFNQGPASTSSSYPTIRTPALPANVQSNLLSVGMRVRKSVPEGYKTGTDFSGFSLWADSDVTNRPVPAVPAARLETRRELLPFCGINKVGGLASQPAFDLPPLPDNVFTTPAMDDLPSLTSSQESVESNAPLPGPMAMATSGPSATNRKRVFAEDDASDMPAVSDRLQVFRNDWLDGEVSPRSLAPVGWENARVMAMPRRRSGRKNGGAVAGAGAVPLASLGQENMALDDFDDAEFLDYQVWGGDMDMSEA